jgi:phosphoribosylaminoimidazole (AIR) synthetase
LKKREDGLDYHSHSWYTYIVLGRLLTKEIDMAQTTLNGFAFEVSIKWEGKTILRNVRLDSVDEATAIAAVQAHFQELGWEVLAMEACPDDVVCYGIN